MTRLHRSGAMLVLLTLLAACTDDFLTTEPPDVLTDEQVWSEPNNIAGVLSGYYARLGDFVSFQNFTSWPSGMMEFDEAIYSGNNTEGDLPNNQILQYPYSLGATWGGNYNLIRDIHVAMDGIRETQSSLITEGQRERYLAELRFMRAWEYFDLVRRNGGVPLITEQQIYDFSGDPSYLQTPRNSEAEVYEFIADEMDAIAPLLGNVGSQSRANRFAALALKSRAMLYAGSLARHNSEMASPITLPNGEVGIPGARANEFYQRSLEASREIINGGAYSLYQSNPDPGANFQEALTEKNGNPEVIWARDYNASGGAGHNWTVLTVPPSLRLSGGAEGSAVSPSLQLVETFDYLDGSPGTMRGTGDGTAASQANWIFYDRPEDIFANKDGRLWGTIVYPGTSERGSPVDIQAGVYVWNESTGRYEPHIGTVGSTYDDGGLLTGVDGPLANQSRVGATGFYPRKYIDSNPAAATSAVQSDVWWVRFRLGEIYLNATEAAHELGLEGEALGYINTLRERAGFPPNSLTSLSREKIRSERWAELAFEEHRFFDLKRWRTAHVVWDGSETSTTANVYSLWSYRVIHPGSPEDGKYVYDKFPAQRQTEPRYWRMGNYYSAIPSAVRGNNPNLVLNPFH